MSAEPIERPMNAREVAERFYVSETTVKRWARRGLLPGFKTLGGWWRFRESDVIAALSAGKLP